jgi:nicotinate-nucleotide adenylyltransferase
MSFFTTTMKVGLYFGSFNPPHNGHLAIAHAAIAHCRLDEIWFVVSPQNPFKTHDALAPETMRLDMVRLVCDSDSRLKALDFEFTLPKPNYTCDTLRLLSAEFPHDFQLIIGEDNWRVFNQWREYQWILDHYSVLVYGRKSTEAQPAKPRVDDGVRFIPGDYLDVSATDIRMRIRNGESVAALIDPEVADYIRREGLYR